MLRIGLTGGTGSGKSTAARRLQELGAVVVDADALAREVVAPGSPGLAAVVREFGPAVLTPDGELDRGALAAVAFSSEDRRRALEAITHPRIAARTAEVVAAAPADAVLVHDVPLLVEKGMGPGYHLVVVVDAPVEVRVQRLVGRGMAEPDARRRIAHQADDAQRRAAADVQVDNAGDPEQLRERVDRLWRDRLAPFRDALAAGSPAPLPGPGTSVPPDPTWPSQAGRLVARVELALDGLLTGQGVRHVGPTARGETAPDVIELDAALGSAADLGAAVERLRAAALAPVPAGTDGTGDPDGLRLASCDPGRPAVLLLRV